MDEQNGSTQDEAERDAQATGGDEPRDPDSVEPEESGVAPVEGDQGVYVNEGESAPLSASPTDAGFDPNRPVPVSAPPPEAQSGVPGLSNGENDGVEPQPQYAGPVDPATPAEAPESDPDEAPESDSSERTQ